MSEASRIDAADLSDFECLAAAAAAGAVAITCGEQVVGGYLPAAEFEFYLRLRAGAQPQVLEAGDFDDEAHEMLGAATYGRIAG